MAILTRSSDEEVNLVIKIGDQDTSLDGIDVSSSGDAYNLNYSDSSGSFSGTVNGNLFTWTMTADNETMTFTGTK